MTTQIERELAKLTPLKETLLSIGVFDGVHLGHQYLISHLLATARQRNLMSGVITFDRHPQAVLSPKGSLPWLNNLKDRISFLRKLGVELVAVLPFTQELAQISAGNFVQFLKKYLKVRGLVIGPDFALGKNREGDASMLKALGKEMGFTVKVIPPFVLNGVAVSSTAIREALTHGNVKQVQKLAGRPFNLSSQVISGIGRGRKLGFPTANLDIKPEQALPGDGIYATIAHINHEPLPSVTNIGLRPTFGGNKRWVEVYLIDYAGQLYGQKLKIDFIDRLRDERRFENAEELKAQIRKDIEQARLILADKANTARVQLIKEE